MPVAAHGERGCPDRSPEIEGEHLRSRVASKLQRHQREQHGLARASRTDDESMPDIADMEGEPERGSAFCPAVEQRGCREMQIGRALV